MKKLVPVIAAFAFVLAPASAQTFDLSLGVALPVAALGFSDLPSYDLALASSLATGGRISASLWGFRLSATLGQSFVTYFAGYEVAAAPEGVDPSIATTLCALWTIPLGESRLDLGAGLGFAAWPVAGTMGASRVRAISALAGPAATLSLGFSLGGGLRLETGTDFILGLVALAAADDPTVSVTYPIAGGTAYGGGGAYSVVALPFVALAFSF